MEYVTVKKSTVLDHFDVNFVCLVVYRVVYCERKPFLLSRSCIELQ